jgi:integrase
MAFLERRGNRFRVIFRYGGRRYTHTLTTTDENIAQGLKGGIEKTLMLLEQKVLKVPAGVEVLSFVLGNGHVEQPPARPDETANGAPPQEVTLHELKDCYLQTHSAGAMEKNSLDTVAVHLSHFERTLGLRFPLQELSLADLQRHVNRRAEKKHRGRRLSPVTLRKEVASFRAAWNWAAHMGMVRGVFPSKGLVYPKADEKPPFMTWQEIERRMTTGQEGLWGCLYLTRPELDELLAYVKEHAAHGFLHPMFCFAAHTGARRSEMLRVLVTDLDFEGDTALIREKKRSRKQRTTRRVPLTAFLAGVLQEWLQQHPGGPYLFCHEAEVFRSKKRSRMTGYTSGRRSESVNGRTVTVRRRVLPGPGPLTKDEVHDHFRRTLTGSKWAVVPGWHCFRHSFISLCASRGTDQRLIDEWVGHQTEEQRKRYRHLLPSTQREAIRSVFGE